MSDPHGTEPLSNPTPQQPVPPVDQDAAPAPETTTSGPQSAPGDGGLGYAPPAPQYAPPPGGYSWAPHPPQGAPARGVSTAPRTSGPTHPTEPTAAAGDGTVPGYEPAPGYVPPPAYGHSDAYGPPQPYPGGSPGYQPPQGYPPPGPRTNPYAIASLVCSLAALVTGVSAIAGIVLGHIALNKIKETGEEGRPLAIAGLAVGYGLLALGAVAIVILVSALALFGPIAATTQSGTF